MRRYVFNPFTALMLFILIGILILVFPLLFLSIVGTSFAKLGFSWFEILLILLFTLIGSFINIPLTTIENRPAIVEVGYSPLLGMMYRIPTVASTTTIAINTGGALIPLLISLYLIYSNVLLTERPGELALIAIGIIVVSLITKIVARPVRGLGIVTPFFIPPIAAAITGLVLAGGIGVDAAVIAYISGTLGTLIGADVLNLHRIRELGAPMVSIGGAGTFDGVFLAGVIAAFLA